MKKISILLIIGIILFLNIVSAEIIERGPDWEMSITDGKKQIRYFPTQVNINQSGTYIPFNNIVDVSFNKQTGELKYSHNDKYVIARLFFVVDVAEVVCNNQDWTWIDNQCIMFRENAREFIINNGIGFDIIINKNIANYKYGLNLTNIPETYQDKLMFVGLRLEEVQGITWDDVQRVGNDIYLFNRVVLSYQDLVDSGHPITFYNKRTLLIGNVSDKVELWLDPIVEYNYTDTTNNKGYYYTNDTSSAIQDASSTLTGEATYTNLLANDDTPWTTTVSDNGASIAQQNYHFTIDEDAAVITQIQIFYSGEASGCTFSCNYKADVKTDASHENFATLDGSDGDYTMNITSSITDYLDGSNKLYVRAYSSGIPGFSQAIRTDYIEIVVDFSANMTFKNTALNDTALNAGERVRLTSDLSILEGYYIDEAWTSITHPNATAVVYPFTKSVSTVVNGTDDLETGTITNTVVASDCADSGDCVSAADEADCVACGCSWGLSCPIVYGWDGNNWTAEHESFPFAIFQGLEESTYDAIPSAKCIDGEMKIKIQENLPELTHLKEFNVILSDGPTSKPDLDGNIRTLNSIRQPDECISNLYNNNDCKKLIKNNDNALYEPEYSKDVIMRELELVYNNVESNNSKLYIDGRKIETVNNYYYYLVHILGANKYPIISKLTNKPILGPLMDKTFGWVRTIVQVWDGTEWVEVNNFGLGHQLENGEDDIVVSIPKLDKSSDTVRIKLYWFDGLFGFDQIYLDDTMDTKINVRQVEPNKIEFNGNEVNDFDLDMRKGDRVELTYSCEEGDTATINITGYYDAISPSKNGDKDLLSALYDWGGWVLIGPKFVNERIDYMGLDKYGYYQHDCTSLLKPPEPYLKRQKETPTLIKFIYIALLITALLIIAMIIKKIPNWVGILIIILIWLLVIIPPIYASTCSGALTCSTHDVDSAACAACSQCLWTAGSTELNSSLTTYSDVNTVGYSSITKLNVTVVVSSYDNSGSSDASNNAMDLYAQMYDGSDWIDIGDFGVSTTGTYSLTTTNAGLLSGWETVENRDIRLHTVDADYSGGNTDSLAWTGVWVYAHADVWGGSLYLDFSETSQEGIYNISTLYSNSTLGEVDLNSTDLQFVVGTSVITITNEAFNSTTGDGGERFKLNVTVNSSFPSQPIDKVWAEMTYPNATLVNYTMSSLSLSDSILSDDLESGTINDLPVGGGEESTYTYLDTGNNKAYHHSSGSSQTPDAATTTGDGEATYTNLVANDGTTYDENSGAGMSTLAQVNFHFTINQSVDIINNMTITYSGYEKGAGIVQLKNDSAYVTFGTLTTSDADYTQYLDSNWDTHIDSGKMYIRAYSIATYTNSIIYNDYIEIEVNYLAADLNTSYTTYENTESTAISSITSLNITVDVSTFNSTASTDASTTIPDLWLEVYNGTGWEDVGDFSVTAGGNVSLITTDATILSAWETLAHRDIRIKGIDYDFGDEIVFDGVWVKIDGLIAQEDWYTYVFTDSAQTGDHDVYTIYANTTDGTLNATTFSALKFTIGSGAGPCDCPSSGVNWAIDMSQNCETDTTCDLGVGNLSFTGVGNWYINATVSALRMTEPVTNQIIWTRDECILNIG